MMFGQNFVPSLWMQGHMLFMALGILGLVMVTVYAAKFMKKDTLMTWIIILVVLGLIGALLTGGMATDRFVDMMKLWKPIQ